MLRVMTTYLTLLLNALYFSVAPGPMLPNTSAMQAAGNVQTPVLQQNAATGARLVPERTAALHTSAADSVRFTSDRSIEPQNPRTWAMARWASSPLSATEVVSGFGEEITKTAKKIPKTRKIC